MSPLGTERTFQNGRETSASGGKAENICFRRACRVWLISEGIWFLNISGTIKLGYFFS